MHEGFKIFFYAEFELFSIIDIEKIFVEIFYGGAIEAGVAHYIDLQLAGPLNRFASLYREGLPAFEPLRQLDNSGQLAFLKAVEKGSYGATASRLFNILIDHTMQGFYGSPAHGGNRDEVSWKMLGIEKVMGGHAH